MEVHLSVTNEQPEKSPTLPVQFFRDGALHGNFYENVLSSILHVFPND